MSKILTQKVEFKATPHQIYEMLMDSKKHAMFTGEKADIIRKIGGKFRVYGKYISGINLDLVPDKRIVQKWRGADWPVNYFSVVIFNLEKSKKGTLLTFIQIGVPNNDYKAKVDG